MRNSLVDRSGPSVIVRDVRRRRFVRDFEFYMVGVHYS